MKYLIALLMFCGLAQAAAPVLTVTPSRTSLNERGCVFFDATGTTSDKTNDFIELLNRVNFGDSSAGTWSYGANTAQSKNFYSGAGVAAHCYTTAGSYTWNWLVSDGSLTDTETGTITVSAFSGANTYCISSNSLPVAGSGGCPSGATAVQQSSWSTIVSTYLATNKKVLLKAGDTFTMSATVTVNNFTGPGMLGSYGSGRAKIAMTCTSNYTTALELTGSTTDLRIVDLEIDGQSDAQCQAIVGTGAVNKIYMDNLYIHDLGGGIEIFLQSATAVYDQIFLTNSHIYNLLQSGGSSYTHGILVATTKGAIMGNLFDTSTAASAEHMIRVQYMAKGLITNNTIKNVAATKEMIALRAPCSAACPTGSGEYYGTGGTPDLGLTGAAAATRYVAVNDNYVDQNTTAGIVLKGVNPNDSTLIDNVVIERNYVIMGSAGIGGIQSQGATIAARNNIVDLNLASDPNTGLQISGATAGASASSNSFYYNNTIYSANGTGTDYGVQVSTGVTTSVVTNNLVYFPLSKSGSAINDSGTGTTKQTNTGDVGTLTTNPQFTGPFTAPIGYAISAASYGANGGTAAFPSVDSDFFGCKDNTGDIRIGAVVPRAQAQCSGVAQ